MVPSGMVTTCRRCGKPFTHDANRNRPRVYCGWACADAARVAPVEMTVCGCGCGEPMPRYDSHGRRRRNLYRHEPVKRAPRLCPTCGEAFLRRWAGTYCSRSCAGKARRNNNAAERRDGAYRRWRLAVLDRDDRTCRGCGRCDGVMHVHHIRPFADNPELRLDVDNGITLCPKCHSWVHRRALAPGVNLRRGTAPPLLRELERALSGRSTAGR